MAIRKLKRQVIIREYDFKKVQEQALYPMDCMGVKDSLYDRASWLPLNAENLEKLKLIEILKGKKHNPLVNSDLDLKHPATLLASLRDYLYNDKYYHWSVTVDEEGYLCVQSRKNTPKTRLGWGIFEKDLVSRL